MSLECSGCKVFQDYPELRSPFYRGLTQQLASFFFQTTHTHTHTSNATPSLPSPSVFLAAQNHTKHKWWGICVLWKCLPLKMRQGERARSMQRPWLGHYQSIQSWCISPNHNLQPQNKCNSCPSPKCLMAVSFSLAGWVCNMAQVVAFDSANKGCADLRFRWTAWCYKRLFSRLKNKSYPTFSIFN